MKKLSKLRLNAEKLIKNEELITLRGGYGCVCYNWSGQVVGSVGGSNALHCNPDCLEYFGHGYGVWS
jgi:natural product precursor